MSHDVAHERAFLRTGRWGRRAAGVLFLAASTGRIGLALRSQYVLEPDTYGLVGGAIDPREDKRVAVTREAMEELGLRIVPSKLIPLDTFREGTFQYTTFLYVLPRECPACRLNWENVSFDWFDLNDLPDNLHPGVAATLAKPRTLSHIARAAGR